MRTFLSVVLAKLHDYECQVERERNAKRGKCDFYVLNM